MNALRYGGGVEVLVMLGLLLSTGALLGVPVSPALLAAGACGAWLAYAAERAWRVPSEDARNHPERVRWIERRAVLLRVGALLAAGVGGMAAVRLPPAVWLLGAGLGVVALGYVALGRRWRRGRVGLAKPAVIALVWAAAGVGAPVLAAHGGGSADVLGGLLLLGAYRFAFLLANTLLADARDAAGDAAEGLVTPATCFGACAVRYAACGSIACALVLAGAMASVGTVPIGVAAFDAVGVAALGGLALRDAPAAAWQIDALAAWPLLTAALALVVS